MRLIGLLASVCAVAAVSSAAHADSYLNYTFDPGTTFNFVDFPGFDYAIAGSFTIDTTTSTVSTVSATQTGAVFSGTFTTGSLQSPTDLRLVNQGGGIFDFVFQHALSQGGEDILASGYTPPEGSFNVDVTGGATAPAVSAAPEPGAWALMLGGVGMLGAFLRMQQARRREHDVKDIATA